MSGRMKAVLAAAKGKDWRRKKAKAQGGRCFYCQCEMVEEPVKGQGRRELTLDHLLPTSRGGAHHWENVVAACITCNGAKGDMTADEFMAARMAPAPALSRNPMIEKGQP
ncbi:HNH endonuclease [Methylorubrum sp. B1-46]|jgi:5-methylcytosine-specific restriction endonuclease McrA|uniref:HNH endonuclease n=1 Tax=Methylorubrum sp. B1-46 TaxID=2897334 RepID=UPI00351D9E19